MAADQPNFLKLTTFDPLGVPTVSGGFAVLLPRGQIGFIIPRVDPVVSRIANNDRVSVRLGDSRGKIDDSTLAIDGVAEVLTTGERFDELSTKFTAMYGSLLSSAGKVFRVQRRFRGLSMPTVQHVAVVVTPDSQEVREVLNGVIGRPAERLQHGIWTRTLIVAVPPAALIWSAAIWKPQGRLAVAMCSLLALFGSFLAMWWVVAVYDGRWRGRKAREFESRMLRLPDRDEKNALHGRAYALPLSSLNLARRLTLAVGGILGVASFALLVARSSAPFDGRSILGSIGLVIAGMIFGVGTILAYVMELRIREMPDAAMPIGRA